MEKSIQPQKRSLILIALGIWCAMWLLVGCQTSGDVPEAVEVAAVEVTAETEATETAVAPTATATEDPPPTPTEEVQVDNCLDCHTSKDLLIQTADPEEEVISENEGAG